MKQVELIQGPITTREILAVLKNRYDGGAYRDAPDWVGIEEARCGTGYNRGRQGAERRIDFFAIHQYPSKDHKRIAFEVKVSRGDWLKELADPRKRHMGLMFSNEFYFVAPPGLIAPEEIPPECGLMECDPNHERVKLMTIVHAPFRDSQPPTWSLLVSILRKERDRSRRAGQELGYKACLRDLEREAQA